VPPKDPFGLVGQVLDGQFRADRYVGEGGFSVVYRGTHIGLSEPIAVKCLKLPPSLGTALVESFVKRFRDESRIHYKLSQGNLYIVRSIASGTTQAPATGALVPYTVLEWLEGQSFADELNDRRERGLKGRPLPEVVKLLDSAVEGLAYAHAQGVVHRDLNPGNLFLAKTAAGTKMKVLDFGVAKILADSALSITSARTIGNVQMFAPAYGAPEQFDSRLGAVGPWTDVYALALLVLEALTDRAVMSGEHLGEYAQAALDPTKRPTPRTFGVAVGDEVEHLMARAVAISPRERPRDAGELWGMLKHAMLVDGERSGSTGSKMRGSDPTELDESWNGPEAAPGADARPPPPTLRLDSAMLQDASKASSQSARRVVRWTPRTGSEALAATPFPSRAAPPSNTPSPSPPPLEAPMPIARPSWAPPPPPSVGTPITASLPPLPGTRRASIIVLLVAAAVIVGAVAAGAWVLWSRTHQAWKTPVTGQPQ
jgi:serine/threonine-protein kinase